MENKDDSHSVIKVKVAKLIEKLIKKKHLTQSEVAKILQVDQPKVSALMSGNLRSFSLERLLRFINLLGFDIEIWVQHSKSKLGKNMLHLIEDSSNHV